MTIDRYLHSLWAVHSLDLIAVGAAQYGLYVCLGLFCLAWLRKRPAGALVPFAACAALAIVGIFAAGLAHQEARPFVVLGVTPLVPHGTDNAFPSDHSAAAAYAATLAAFIDPPVGAAAWIVTVALGAGRIYCLLHTPVDVVAGWVIGAGPAVIAALWWQRNRRRSS